ncbi:MAG TPA: DUF3396 domain-containing protein [Sandaracinaceae bacterium LLY-WYZ-13_1]|nr:DUF3396 domain-containing protein [Sandaracinaceae bacterium LLY-WYZ-13_1]
MSRLPLPPKQIVLDADRGLPVVRVAKGLTVYFDDGVHWSASAATELFDAFLTRADRDRLSWFTTSMMHRWQSLRPEELPGLREQLVADRVLARVRHLFTFEVADARMAPVLAFRYHEIDAARARHAGWLQLLFPRAFSGDELLALMLEIGQLHPVCCASAGWVASVAPGLGGTAFDGLYGMCKRYLGLDVAVPERGCRRARSFLPSPAWLTLLGPSVLRPEETTRIIDHPFQHPGIRTFRLAGGLLLQAGAAPELGDGNLMELPVAMAEVAQVLDPWIDPRPIPFDGRWSEGDSMHAWVHRFASLEAWL